MPRSSAPPRIAAAGARRPRRNDVSAHLPQRRDHPLHGRRIRDASPTSVAVEYLPGEDTGEQAHAGPGIAHVQRGTWRPEPLQAGTVYAQLAALRARRS
jgi:hypothetical protein